KFYMENGETILVSKPLKKYEDLLSGFGFCRVHQSHLVILARAWQQLDACYQAPSEENIEQEGAADAGFHMAIAEASHNVILLHTMRNLFNLLRSDIVTNIGGMYSKQVKTRQGLIDQHQKLYAAIIEGRADDARAIAAEHIEFVQKTIAEHTESERRRERALRRENR
ncbi:MAG: FCD domain-containing protein, partial [Marinobacter sp.]